MITFVVGVGRRSHIVEELWDETTWWETEHNVSDITFEHITVNTASDRELFIETYDRYLAAEWTPNQTEEEREENGRVMKACQETMDRLRIKEN